MTIPNLHDATLVGVELGWAEGRVRLHFSGSPYRPGGPFSICWRLVSELHVTRNEPWGPSVSVLEAKETEPGLWLLLMQSGDEIRIRGNAPVVEELATIGLGERP